MNYLNVGCGNKFHTDWVNIDMTSHSPNVKAVNLINGIPFPDNYFDVVYHSQVLEHIPKENAPSFIEECFRVLKPNGIIRIVVPDLENIVDEYKKWLDENFKNPNTISEANYDWILIEMFDQMVRNYSGGQMADIFKRPQLINEKYVIDRIGFVGREIRNNYLNPKVNKKSVLSVKNVLKYIIRKVRPETSRVGTFRLGGEIHMWMYDRYSLSRLLKDCGFENISIKTPFESDIPNWKEYELDVKDGLVYDPNSLFIEAIRH